MSASDSPSTSSASESQKAIDEKDRVRKGRVSEEAEGARNQRE